MFMLLTAPDAGAALLREKSPPYGSAARKPAEVVRRLVEGWHALARAESAVALTEGDTLRLVLDERVYVKLGYSSFHDFCVEAIETTSSTGKRRVELSRLTAAVPDLREALVEGVVSPCQALVLRPG